MWPFSSRKARTKNARRSRPRANRPSVRVLEDRLTPASLSYSTFFDAVVFATAVDNAGDAYITGYAGSGLPTTPGAFHTTGSGAFVAKFSPTGTLDYATYLGNGDLYSGGYGIAVDASGDAYVIGGSSVPSTANAIASSGNISVAELNPTGSGLLYATYLPGALNGYITLGLAGAVAVDGSGNIYVAGAAAAGLPVTAGAFQTSDPAGANGDAFFMKIDPALSGPASVLYASYLGGSSSDQATGIAVDSSGNAYLEGFAGSADFPTTSGAFQRTSLGGNAFVAKFDPSLSGAASLVYSTYLGGSGEDGYVSDNSGVIDMPEISGGIAVDSAGDAYVTSGTTSMNFPTTAGAYQTAYDNKPASGWYAVTTSDAFVAKLNPTGSALVYSTYLGGGTNGGGGTLSSGAAINVDANGDAYVTGWTNSTTFPVKNAIQSTNQGGMDAFVTELNPAGSGLLFSTYLGGSGDDYGFGLALDSAGNTYVAGQTSSSNFPTTPGAYNTSGGTGFAAKINLAPSPSFAVAGFPSSTTAGVSHTFTVTALNADGTVNTGYTGTVQFGSSDPKAVLPANYIFTAADQGVHTFTVTLKTAGTQSITATDTATGSITGSESGITVNPAAASTLVINGLPSSVTQGKSYTFTVTALDPYGNVATGYTGTVHLTSSDPLAKLPANYTFTAADAGRHTFSVTFNTVGTESLTVTDTLYSSISGIDTGITVTKKRR
jgi:hypothetical protein